MVITITRYNSLCQALLVTRVCGVVCVHVGVVVCRAPSFMYPQGRVWSKGSHFPVLEVRISWLNQVTQLCVVHYYTYRYDKVPMGAYLGHYVNMTDGIIMDVLEIKTDMKLSREKNNTLHGICLRLTIRYFI